MQTLNIDEEVYKSRHRRFWSRVWQQRITVLALSLLTACLTFSACGGSGSSSTGPQPALTLAGNWQFTVAPPSDGSYLGGLQGGFLLQQGGAVSGAAVYAVSLP